MPAFPLSGSKRQARDWDDIDDPEDLRELLRQKEQKIEALKKQNADLRRLLKQQEQEELEEADPSALEDMAVQWRKGLHQNLLGQMTYKTGLKHSSTRASAMVPNVSLVEAQAIMGPDLAAAAKNTKKQLAVNAANDQVNSLLGELCKSLRYGSKLAFTDAGLKFVYEKEHKVLKVSGLYTMV